MKKILIFALTIVLAAAFTGKSNAQLSLGFNGGISIPNGNFSNHYNKGYGGSLNAEFNVAMIGIGINAGGYMYSGKYNTVNTFTSVPVILDIKYYFLPLLVKPYIGLGGGKYFEMTKGSKAVNYIGLAPEVGVNIGLKTKIGVCIKYNIVPQGKLSTKPKFYNNLGANIGLMFPLNLL